MKFKIALFAIMLGFIFSANNTFAALQVKKVATLAPLSQEQKAQVVTHLNDLLANLSVFYQNARGLHWNVRGNHFFDLHLKYEELYNDLLLKIDEIAERILALDNSPVTTYEEYFKIAQIKSVSNISDANEGVKNIVASLNVLIEKERAIFNLTAGLGDDATNNIVAGYIQGQQKLLWMYKAFLYGDNKF